MRVLHYLMGMPPVRKGGLPQYALSLIAQQNMQGNDVKILIPGPFTKSGITKIVKWKVFQDIPSYRIINPLPVPNAFGIREIPAFTRSVSTIYFDNWLVEQRIDIIHVHSIMGLPLEFLYAAKRIGIKIVMTTHDFFGLCPKIDLMKDEKVCKERDWSQCYECCKHAYGVNKLKVYHSDLYWWYCNQSLIFKLMHSKKSDKIKDFLRNKRNANENDKEIFGDKKESVDYSSLRNYYNNMLGCIDYFLFNSRQTEKVYRQCLDDISGEVIHVFNSHIKDCRTKKEFSDVLQLGYVGNKTVNKGYYFLMDNLQKFYDTGKTKFKCHTFLLENDIEYPFVVNHGLYKYGKQDSIYKNIDMLIVPSVWKETFGLVVLEAISNGVPVLVSENVGAKEIINDYPGIGIVFPLSDDKFTGIIEQIYEDRNILVSMNKKIIDMEYDFSMEKHAVKVEAAYNKVLNKIDGE